ncbi:MAG: acyl-CoA dehydrogenase family protein [Pseudomonadales bacterium]|nr:acyl-CoA dehydrogenase family protein [Pseudomonadales bacterium]MCP5182540.1 acyl-CoA dehydrogenase family protein [Pseudomonadales bacterium]
MTNSIEARDRLVGTPLERVERLRSVIAEGGDKAQELRRLPQDVVDKLIDEGLFRFALPRELGGEDASSLETIEVLEAISAIDASVGWNVMLGSEINAMAAGGMPRDLAKEVYIDNPRVVMCGGGGPGSTPSRAIEQKDGSFKIWGETTFISGCHNSTWCFMTAPIMDGDKPRIGADGAPMVKTWFMHRSQWEILDTWDMAGLRGSGSHNVRADGAVVEPKWFPVELMKTPALHENPVFRMPVPLRLSYNKVAIGLGVAKGALEAFVDIANNKVPMLSASKLMDRPIAQYRMAEMTAKYRAARALVFEAMNAVEEELKAGAEAPSTRTTVDARLACTYGAQACMEVVDVVHAACGTSAAQMNGPLERKLRDAHGCASHRWVAHPLYETLGGILFGKAPDAEFAGTGGPVLGGSGKR